jgi:hypothetical protein
VSTWMSPLDREYSMHVADDCISVAALQDGTSMPVIYLTRFVGRDPWRGYGTTEAEAVVDLLRNRRDRKYPC